MRGTVTIRVCRVRLGPGARYEELQMYQGHKDDGGERTVSRGSASMTPWDAMRALHDFRNPVDTVNRCIEIVLIRDNAIVMQLWHPGDSLTGMLAGLYRHDWGCPPGPEIRNGDVIEIRLNPYATRTPSPPGRDLAGPHKQTPPPRKKPRALCQEHHAHFEAMRACLQRMAPVQA